MKTKIKIYCPDCKDYREYRRTTGFERLLHDVVLGGTLLFEVSYKCEVCNNIHLEHQQNKVLKVK